MHRFAGLLELWLDCTVGLIWIQRVACQAEWLAGMQILWIHGGAGRLKGWGGLVVL
jgi:hypothetical protein